MTINLKPSQLIAMFIALGIVIAVIAVIALSGGDDGGQTGEVTGVTESESPTAIGPDEPPTNTPEPPPATETPPPTETPPSPTSTPEPTPVIRSCEEIRAAGDYLNPEERAFFLDNCTTQEGPTASEQAGPVATAAPDTSGATAEEEAYRRKASGFMLGAAARFVQFFNSGVYTSATSQWLELGSIAGGWANQMAQLEPVPPRFKQAHDQLRAALYEFNDWCQLVIQVETEADAIYFIAGALTRLDAVGAAWEDYELVVGISLPDPPR